MVTLEVFEYENDCTLGKWQINLIKEHIEYTIDVINRGLKEGRSFYTDGFIHNYWSELVGMRSICSMIGIKVITPYVDEEEIIKQ